MGVEGIGASVVRKEDRRFITGKGRYVDDIKLLGMTHAHFIRSPHAHAKVKSIDSSAAMEMPGVVGVLTGQQLVDDKIGNLICGWAITSKDGSPMKMGAWPAMAPETVRFVGQAIAVVIAETKNQARDAAEAVVVNYEELPAVPDIRAAIKPDDDSTKAFYGKEVSFKDALTGQVPPPAQAKDFIAQIKSATAAQASAAGWYHRRHSACTCA